MSKPTTKKLKGKAVFPWQQNVDRMIVYPQSWGFFLVRQWNYIKVIQPFWIIYWNPTPGLMLNVDGEEFVPDPDKIYLFPPYTRFHGKFCKPFIQFAVHFLAEAPFDRVDNRMLVMSSDNIVPLIMNLSPSNTELQNIILLQQIILNVLGKIPIEAFLPQKKPLLDPRIKEILKYINSHPGERHTVEGLSGKAKMSVNNFHRRFLLGTGVTPKQYLKKIRMEYAKKLFLETEMNIDEVASASGFLDRYHFSKTFKNYFLFSPAAFRKKFCGADINDQSAI